MRLTAKVDRLRLADEFKAEVGRRFSAMMKRETRALEKNIEAQVEGAGLGKNMARTWNSRVFPGDGRPSLGPAGVVWSKAPVPMRAHSEGAVIVPKNGRFLAIPTQWNRQGGRRGGKPRVTPQQMAAAKGQAFVMKSRLWAGVRLWCLRTAAASGRSARARFNVRAGGLLTINTGNARVMQRMTTQRLLLAQGFVPMFVLVDQVTLRKRLNFVPLVNAAIASIRVGMASAIAEASARFR
jgi:hypothetical protein